MSKPNNFSLGEKQHVEYDGKAIGSYWTVSMDGREFYNWETAHASGGAGSVDECIQDINYEYGMSHI